MDWLSVTAWKEANLTDKSAAIDRNNVTAIYTDVIGRVSISASSLVA
jgi:hypothetical protein